MAWNERMLPSDIRRMAQQLLDDPTYYIPSIIPKLHHPLPDMDRELVIEELTLYLQTDDAEKVPDAIRRARVVVKPETSSFVGSSRKQSKKKRKKKKTKRR